MTKRKRKGLKKFLTILAAIVAIVLLYEVCIWFMSDRIIRLTFNGFENMFTVHDEYYAVAGPFRAPVPKALVQTVTGTDPENVTRIDDVTGNVFFVQVNYSKTGRPTFEGTTTLIHSYSNKYVFEVTSPGPDECVVSRSEEQAFLDIAEHFYDFNQEYVKSGNNWLSMTGNSTYILAYDVFMNGDKTVFVIDQPGKPYEVYSYSNGEFTKIMNVPEKGDFDIAIWKN